MLAGVIASLVGGSHNDLAAPHTRQSIPPVESIVNPEWRNRYELAVEAARKAGQLALRYFDGEFTVEWKSDLSPVTVADRETEQLLRRTLLDAFPHDGFLGEEFGDTPGSSGFR